MADTTGQHMDSEPIQTTQSRGGMNWPRVAVGLVFVAALVLLGLMGYKMVLNAGWFGGLGGAVGGAPGVFTSGQLAKPSFRKAPDFTLQTFSGETLRLSDLRGKPVMLNFWASWCPPCREEAPLLEDTWREYREKGVVFVGVNVWDSEKDARTFLSEYDITYPNGRDPGTGISIEYGLSGIPETFFIDRQGNITRKWIGPFTEETLKAFLDEMVAGETRTQPTGGAGP